MSENRLYPYELNIQPGPKTDTFQWALRKHGKLIQRSDRAFRSEEDAKKDGRKSSASSRMEPGANGSDVIFPAGRVRTTDAHQRRSVRPPLPDRVWHQAEQRLHAWLTRLKDELKIGPWFSDGISADHRGTVAFIEFERDGDAAVAKSMWGRERVLEQARSD
jgi:hypothetical protein